MTIIMYLSVFLRLLQSKDLARGVILGNNVWVGSNVVLLKRCEIGDNSVIAAGAVVDRKIPSYSIYRRDGSIEKIVPSYG